jgi:hypothetical protein
MLLAAALAAVARSAVAQSVTAQSVTASVGAQVIGLYTHADPVPGGGTADEVRAVQPIIMLHAALASQRLVAVATANLEGLTIPGGELAPGDWGEGFVDRRHPHTYAHELILSANNLLGALDGPGELSLSAGKGFAPFGTDDPMARPVIRYPVNHHLAQILERAIVIAAARRGPVGLEAAIFNGDEPERPGEWPRVAHRLGDSWSTRLTARPTGGLELQGSYAHVHSAEHRPGAGPDQAKWSGSARWDAPIGGHPVYVLAEWARTAEADFFVYRSLLAEGAWEAGAHRLLWRVERTDRPEESRTADPFRSLRPHLDNSILGRTRWSILTAGYALRLSGSDSPVRIEPQVEVAFGTIRSLDGLGFDPVTFYGRDRFWTINLGVRAGWGMTMHRMGRYGAAEPAGHGPNSHMQH